MYHFKNIPGRIAAIAFAGLLLCFHSAFSAPVTAGAASSAVQGWLHQDRRPLGAGLSRKVKRSEAVKDASGNSLYYVVHLDPPGFVILPADDTADPIVAFSASGSFDASSGSPLAALVNRDLPRRATPTRAKAAQAQSKWHAFRAGSANPPPDMEENGEIVVASQIWVAPLVQTLWDQSDDVSDTFPVYNLFTPDNDPCGCVATCMAQVMYYFKYPNTAVGTSMFVITNDTTPETTALFGGNGTGGVYEWTNMPLSPNKPTTVQATAIGYLTHDTGAAVNMWYTPDNSSASTFLAYQALGNTFKFANVGYYEEDKNGLSAATLLSMINPNLDAGLPVMLGIQSPTVGGHCLVCDGYGYSSGTLFYHLNTGWGGDDDIWYSLPSVDTPDNGVYNIVNACVYNIYTNGNGQIISGRVTDPTGAPVAGATITATGSSGPYAATTDANGIYALTHVSTGGTFTLTATKAGGSSATSMATTGTSAPNQLPSGNYWGANFVLSPALLAVPESGFASIGPVNGPFSVLSQVYNLTNTAAVPINWTLSNTSAWLSVTSTNGTLPAGTGASITIALSPAASSLAAGTYSASIWITNLNNGVTQQLQFSLAVETADYPIAVTGYNEDVVVESNAVGGNAYNYADAFDPVDANLNPAGPVCFYEAGLVAANLAANNVPAVLGLPPGGLFTSAYDHATTFQFGPYDGDNVLYLTQGAPSGTLTLNTPAAFKSLSVLAASAQGGGVGKLVIQFTDGSTASNITFNAANYLTTNTPGPGAAISDFGLLAAGGPFNEFLSLDPPPSGFPFPTLYQTSTNLHAAGLDGKLISSVTFTMPPPANTNTATGIFALSGTQTAYTGDYLLTVVASPARGGTVGGGGSFLAGSINTVTAATNGNYLFDNWTQGGIVVSTSTNYTFTLNGNETLVANYLTYYTVTVNASPGGGGTVAGGGTFLQGSNILLTATPNGGYEFIGWTGNDSGTSPTLPVTVNGNLDITANFAPATTGITWSILTNNPAEGTVSLNLHGGSLMQGRNYTLTATALKGNLFSNWTGSIVTNKNPLTLKAESNMVIEANFVPNPFLPVQGTYNGLFSVSNAPSEATSGMLKNLTITEKGTYSGALLINGASHGVTGSFNLGGQATNQIKRALNQGGSLTLTMTFNGSEPPPQVTGTVASSNSGVPWLASLTAAQATNAVHSAEFTLLLPPDANNSPPTGSPGGDGYALITNDAGTVKITGALADGAAFSQTVAVSQDGYVPLYASLYSGNGSLQGWINLDLTNTAGAGLTWIHPAMRSGLYTNGFINVLSPGEFLLSQWNYPPLDFASLTNLFMLDTINGEVLSNIGISVAPSGKITVPSGEAIGSIAPKTGLVTVTMGSGKSKVTGHGAMIDGTNGGGYFLTKTNAQAIQLEP